MSRRSERREAAGRDELEAESDDPSDPVELDLQELREALDGRLTQEQQLALPAPPRAAPALTAALPPTDPRAVGAPAPKRRGRPPKVRPAEVEDRLAELEAGRPERPRLLSDSEPPPPAVQAQPAPRIEPPAPIPPPNPPSRETETMTKEQKQGYHQEPPYELMAEHIEKGYGPEVWAEIRRLLPNGGTTTIRRSIQMPITAWAQLGYKASTLLAGGGSYILMLAQNKGERAFISWKEAFEGPPRASVTGITLCYNPDTQDFELTQMGVAELGGIPIANANAAANAYNPYAGSMPPAVPAGGGYGPAGPLSPPGYPVFPRPIRDTAGRLLPPPEALTSPWMRHYPVEQQWDLARDDYMKKHNVALPDMASATSVALQWTAHQGREVEQARTQAARYEERLDATKDRSQALLESERMARASLERQVAELRASTAAQVAQVEAQRREEAFQAKMNLLEMKIAQAQGGGSQANLVNSLAALAPLAAAFAPVAAAYVSSSRQAATAEIAAREESQRTMLMAITQKQSSGLSELTPLLAALTPLLAPAFARWLENQDPSKVDEAKHNQDQRNLMMLKFMFDSMAQMQGGEGEPEPWWMRFLKEMAPQLMGLGKMAMLEAGRAADRNARELPQGPMPQQPLPRAGETQVLRPEEAPAPVVAPPPAPTTSFALDIAGTVQRFAEVDLPTANLLGFILQTLSETKGAEGFLTHEWAAILFHMHHAQLPVEDLATLMVDHLEHSRTFALIPPPISNVFAYPREALMQIIPALPIWVSNQAYAQSLLDATVEEIQMRERERIEAEREAAAEAEEDEENEDEEESEPGEPGTAIVQANAAE